MTNPKLTLSIAALSCLLIPIRVCSQEPGGKSGARSPEVRLKLFEAEAELKHAELELKTLELAAHEATLEVKQFKLHVEAAQREGDDSLELAHARIELDQVALRAEMQKTEVEMARLKVERVKARLEYIRAAKHHKEHHEAIARQLKAAVQAGELTESEAKQKWSEVEKAHRNETGTAMRARGIDQPQSQLDVKVFSVANAKARDLATVLKELFLSDGPSPIYLACDARTNSLIVRGPASDLAIVEALLSELDRE